MINRRRTARKLAFTLWAALALCLALALPAMAVNSYQVEKIADDLPRGLQSVGRITHGNVDRLLFGDTSSIYMYGEGWATVGHLADLRGPYNPYSGILSVFTDGGTIYATSYSRGQGLKLDALTMDENGVITSTKQTAFEWTLADHDLTDKGIGYKDPRKGRLIIGYGNPHRHSEAPDWEAGMPLKGGVMEYGQPTPGQWDAWTNQLQVPADSPKDSIGLLPDSFVVRDDNKVITAAHGSDDKTYFLLLDSIPWDGDRPPAPSPRAPQVQGYWSFIRLPSGTIRSLGGLRDIWDPYVQDGKFNDIYFVFGGDVLPSYFYADEMVTRHACGIYHPDGSGGWVKVDALEGEAQAAAVHPATGMPIIVASHGGKGMGVYEATRNEDGGVDLYRAALINDSGFRWLLVHALGDSVYIADGGNMYRVRH